VHESFAIFWSNSYHGMIFYTYLWMIRPYCNVEVASYLQILQLFVGIGQGCWNMIYDRCSDDGGHLPANKCSFCYCIQYSKHIVQVVMSEVMFTSFVRILHLPVILDSPWGATLEHQYAIRVIFNKNLITPLYHSTHEL
jgi:hypothetical protein